MTSAWDLLVGRDDLARTELRDAEVPVAGDGEVVLRTDLVGMTANNVTYALVGDTMRYWNFFPVDDEWGRVPLWGFADVIDSNVDGVEVGARIYGYLPTSSHLLVKPDRLDPRGFRDSSSHRDGLPAPYNLYTFCATDPVYDPDGEELIALYRPLFVTSWVLEDFLHDNEWFGAETVVISSASSKTSYGAAHLVHERSSRPRVVGLTSKGNVEFTESLGCYDEVLTYDDVETLPLERTVYVDVAGSRPLRLRVHTHLGDQLRHDAVVGLTHHDTLPNENVSLPGPKPAFFFAPDQLRKRRGDWGPGEVDKRFADAWRGFLPSLALRVDVVPHDGAEALREVWLETFAGTTDPRAGHVVRL